MPRKRLVRRFEPRYGVSEQMIAYEAKYVAREVEDHELLSITDLKQALANTRKAWSQAEKVLKEQVPLLAEREQLALQAMIVRDCYHIFELYLAHVKSLIESGSAPNPPPKRVAGIEPVLPFSEWLFQES